jgi:hypothetical protein
MLFSEGDTGQSLSAWIAREELLALAATVDAWWPKINALARTAITNACTEDYNRLVKQVERQLRIPEARALRAKYDSTAPANSGPQPRFMLIVRSKSKSRLLPSLDVL